MNENTQMTGSIIDLLDFWLRKHVCQLTKREYFAALAMQGICASSFFSTVFEKMKGDPEIHIAQTARIIADALIVELNKEAK